MDLADRIARRRRRTGGDSPIVDRRALSPATHPKEPVDRGSVLEQLLDLLDPVFDGDLPPPVAVTGPPGTGKTALVRALFTQLDERLGHQHSAIKTTTRAEAPSDVHFVYVDANGADSRFQFYRALLDAFTDDTVPTRGVSTDTLASRIDDALVGSQAVVAVDHLDPATTLTVADVDEFLAPFADAIQRWVVTESLPPAWTGDVVTLDPYRTHQLVDLLMARASEGLEPSALSHDLARTIAEWADGNAHDALAALFCAALAADDADVTRIREADVDAALASVPRQGVHVDRLLALPANRAQLLAELIAADADGLPIAEAAALLAARTDLTESTIRRMLYELADEGILERVQVDGQSGSVVVPRFPARLFGELQRASV